MLTPTAHPRLQQLLIVREPVFKRYVNVSHSQIKTNLNEYIYECLVCACLYFQQNDIVTICKFSLYFSNFADQSTVNNRIQ